MLIVDLFVVVAGAFTFGLNKGFFSLAAVIANGLLVDKLIDMITKYKEKKLSNNIDEQLQDFEETAC